MIRRPTSRLLAASAAVIALAACDQESISLASGELSTLEVLVYVDTDGNGMFGPGDEAIAGASVTAEGPVSRTASSGADGIASFTDLLPGGYTLSATGSVPEGAVLATASNPTVTAPFQGAELQAQFRYAFEPGTIAGRLYRDDNDNGVFDSGVDLPAAGITVTAVRASDDAEFTTTTDAEGAFQFSTLRPDTYVLTFALPSEAGLVGGSQVTVEVGGDAELSLDAVFEGDLLVDIAEARQAPLGQSVTVEGVITWVPSFDDRVIFFQDATGGITTFDFDLSDLAPVGGFQRGQRIRAIAQVGAFRGELQLGSFQSVELLGTVPVPTPEGVTGTSINAGDDQGELVTITATVDEVDVLSFGNQLVTMTDGAGTSFSVYVDSRTGITDPDWTVGSRYRVTGVLGFDNRNTPAAQLEPREPGDQVLMPGTGISIAEARALFGETVTVSGTVSRALGWTDRQAFIQDETGGVTLFTFDGLPALAPGDLVTVTGAVGGFGGEIQIGPDMVTIDGSGPAPAPLIVSGEQINGGLFQGRLVQLSGDVTAVEAANTFGSANVTVVDADGTAVTVFVDNRSGLDVDDFAVGQELVIVGVPGFFDQNDPGAQLEVIVDTDVTFVN